MAWKWFGAKSLYRTATRGRARSVDGQYVPGSTLVEERIVLVKARSQDEALRRADDEARAYARQPKRTNRYGQEVVTRYLESVDVFEMFEPPGQLQEVFSSMYTIGREVSDSALCENHFGPSGQPLEGREQFMDGDISTLRWPRRGDA